MKSDDCARDTGEDMASLDAIVNEITSSDQRITLAESVIVTLHSGYPEFFQDSSPLKTRKAARDFLAEMRNVRRVYGEMPSAGEDDGDDADDDPHFRVVGEVSDDILNRTIEIAFSGAGKKTRPGDWKNTTSTVRDWLNSTTWTHQSGRKDGFSYLQGKAIRGVRTVKAIEHLDLLVLDLDTGENIETLRRAIKAHGWFAIVSTTHSHMTTESLAPKDAVVKWRKKISPNATAKATADEVANWFVAEKKYQPWVVEGATLMNDRHTADKGVCFALQHKPLPKYRIAFVLKRRFVIGEEAETQGEAITIWKEKYAGVSDMLGAYHDSACVDPSRLFYGPRHSPAATDYFVEIIGGEALNLDTVESVGKRRGNAFSRAAEEMGARGGDTYQTPGLAKFAAMHARAFEIADFLEEHMPDDDLRGSMTGATGIVVRCPWEDNHSATDDGGPDVGCFAINASEAETETFVWGCQHNSCQDKDRLARLDKFLCDNGLTVADCEEHLVEITYGDAAETAVGDGAEVEKVEASDDTDFSAYETFTYVAEGHGIVAIPNDDGGYHSKTWAAFEKWKADDRTPIKDPKTNVDKLVPTTKLWLLDQKTRRALGWTFQPSSRDAKDLIKQKSGAFLLNKWRGLAITPKLGDWSRMQQHILEVLANSDKAEYTRIVGWLAWNLQNVGDLSKKLPCALVVMSEEEGTGKSIVFDWYGKIHGKHHKVLSQDNEIKGDFNASFGDATFVQLEEAYFGSDPRINGSLKQLLTGEKMTLRELYCNPVTVPNFMHFVIISNNKVPIFLSESGRRYHVIKASPHRKGQKAEWFIPIVEQMKAGGLEAMAYDLLNWTPPEGGDWSFLHKMGEEHTDAAGEILAAKLSPIERFLIEWVWKGSGDAYGAMHPIDLNATGGLVTSSAEIAREFGEWVERPGNVVGREKDKVDARPATIGLWVRKVFGDHATKEKSETHNRLRFPEQSVLLDALSKHANKGYRAQVKRLEEE